MNFFEHLIEFSLDRVSVLRRGSQFVLRFAEASSKLLRHPIHLAAGVGTRGNRVGQLLSADGWEDEDYKWGLKERSKREEE